MLPGYPTRYTAPCTLHYTLARCTASCTLHCTLHPTRYTTRCTMSLHYTLQLHGTLHVTLHVTCADGPSTRADEVVKAIGDANNGRACRTRHPCYGPASKPQSPLRASAFTFQPSTFLFSGCRLTALWRMADWWPFSRPLAVLVLPTVPTVSNAEQR